MLTVTNYNRQTPNFQARMKMGQTSAKIGQYLKNKGINPNHLLIGGLTTTAGAAGVSLASPDLIEAPDAAKYGVLGGLASTTGAMFASMRKRETNINKDNSDEQVQTTTKTASPLVMLGLGSSLGIGIPFAISPIVQHNAKKISEQKEEIANLKKDVEQQKQTLSDTDNQIAEKLEQLAKIDSRLDIENGRVYHIQDPIVGDMFLTEKGLDDYRNLTMAQPDPNELKAIYKQIDILSKELPNWTPDCGPFRDLNKTISACYERIEELNNNSYNEYSLANALRVLQSRGEFPDTNVE